MTLSEEKFTPEFMAEFSGYMFPLDSLKDHAEQLAHVADQLGEGVYGTAAAELGLDSGHFEGYGDLAEMGIAIKEIDFVEAEAEEVAA